MKKMRKPMRNPAACNPLMRKGGPHQPGRQTVRPRLDWRDALEDYDDWQQEEENEEGPDGPSFFGAFSIMCCHGPRHKRCFRHSNHSIGNQDNSDTPQRLTTPTPGSLR